MMPGPLFESTESVIEILWDVALAVFVIRIAFFYVSLAATVIALFAWSAPRVLPAACLPQVPDVGEPTAPASACYSIPAALALSSVSVLIAAVCARITSTYFSLPRVASYRLAIGVMALFYIGMGTMLVALFVPPSQWPSGHMGLSIFFAFAIAVMPWLSMYLMERPRRTSFYDSRQQSSVTDEKRTPVVQQE